MTVALRATPLVCLTLAGCANPADTGARAVHRDSAGVRIVESRRAMWPDSGGWSIPAEPTFQLGEAEGDTLLEFTRIRTVTSLADGRIAVAVGQPPQIRIFDRSGRFVGAAGRPGEGPGEFRSLSWIQRIAGDTIVALDAQLRRITAFTADGSVAWTVDVHGAGGGLVAGPVRIGDGSILLHREQDNGLTRVATGRDRAGQTLRATATLVRYDRTGAELNIIARGDGAEGAIMIRGGAPAMVPAPFGRNFAYTLADHTVFAGAQDAYEIREYDADGKIVGLIRWTGPDLTITPSDVEAVKREQLDRVRGNAAAGRSIEQFFSDLPFPPARAAYGRLLVDAPGNLWAAGATLASTESAKSWIVFNAEHEMLGEVRMPDRFDLHEVGTDHVLGRWRDDAGVEYVRIYRLTR